MSKYEKLAAQIVDKMFEGYSVGQDGKLVVVNEGAAKPADEAIRKMIRAKMQDRWSMLEAQDGSLADLAGEIKFEELNADPSGMATTTAGAVTEPKMESARTFNFKKVFEGLSDFETADNARPMMDDETDGKGEDGDEKFNDLQMGMDDSDMGGDDMSGDIDSDTGSLDGADSDLDDMTDDSMGGDLDDGETEISSDSDMGTDDGFDFDFTDLDDLDSDMGGDEDFGGDDLGGDDLGGDTPAGDEDSEMHHGDDEPRMEESFNAKTGKMKVPVRKMKK